jgi:hypothetical protein
MAMVSTAGAQTILFEYWDNIGGTAVSDLTGNANYPDSPTSSAWLETFQSPSGRADNYGVRARAYLTPPETGDYTFWVSGDDYCQLWLSTDDTAANAKMIAQVAGWTGVAEWTKYAAQKSAPMSLVAGQAYYIEALMKEGGGGDSLEVGWAGPGIGEATTILAGTYCTPFVRYQARGPVPANGAINVTSPMFEWTPGDTAANHQVYFGTTADLTEANLQMGTWPNMFYYIGTLEPGATYYWRVDGIEEDGDKITGKVWSFTVQPMTASAPSPEDDAVDVATIPTLSWTAGQTGVQHKVYLSKDEALVAAGDASVLAATQAETSFTPATALAELSTYYWRVDEVDNAGAVIAGEVWSFSTIDYIAILSKATTLTYDNSVEPYVASLDVATPADLTAGGLTADLEIQFVGRTAPTGEVRYDEATGTYSLAGAGADIWGNADQFAYAYKTLNGDGAMIARVASSGTGSNAWSKGGVMIRQSLAAGSAHAFMPITGGNGASFQRRLAADGSSTSYNDGTGIVAPYWVKVERVGNSFTGSVSANGVEWKQLGDPITIEMTDPVFIGLAVTSHATGEYRTFTFDNVSTTGNVAPEGVFTSWDAINVATNAAAPIGVSLTDAAGNVAAVAHDDPAATQTIEWTTWKVPLAEFSGVDLTNVVNMQFTVGDGLAGGSGVVTFNNVRTVPAAVEPATILWVSFHAADDAPSTGAVGVGFTSAVDKPYTDLLKANGYNVVRYVQTGTPDLSLVNAADLVILGRSVSSGSFQNDAASIWNAQVTAPMLITNGYLLRSSRLGYTTGTNMPDTTGDIALTATDPTHPIFAGISLTDGTMDNPYTGVVAYPTDGTVARGTSINSDAVDDEGAVLAVVSQASAATGPAGAMIIGEWQAGASLTHAGGAGTDVLGSHRLVFLTGGREASGKSSETAGLYDLHEDGAQMFLNAVEYMLQ